MVFKGFCYFHIMLFDIVLDTIWSSNLVHFWSQVGPKLDQQLIKKSMQKYNRFWNWFLIDFGPTWLQFWSQLGPKLDLNRCTFGTILEQMFKKSQDRPKYANLASIWRHFGFILVSFWVQIGSKCRYSTSMAKSILWLLARRNYKSCKLVFGLPKIIRCPCGRGAKFLLSCLKFAARTPSWWPLKMQGRT